jgi:hypothetical protein
MTIRSLRSDLAYVGDLVEAGMDGFAPLPAGLWIPAVIGAAAGAAATYLIRDRKPGYGVATGALLGGAAGLSGSVLWGSRSATAAAARSAARRVSAVRDARWLEKHPIAYA